MHSFVGRNAFFGADSIGFILCVSENFWRQGRIQAAFLPCFNQHCFAGADYNRRHFGAGTACFLSNCNLGMDAALFASYFGLFDSASNVRYSGSDRVYNGKIFRSVAGFLHYNGDCKCRACINQKAAMHWVGKQGLSLGSKRRFSHCAPFFL